MTLSQLSDLPSVKTRAVIINVSTKWVTTLALLSALRQVQMPVLVIDCESKDGSLEHFTRLMKDYPFDLTTAPLKPHGYTLDWLFKNLPAENILLIDSDTELLNRTILDLMETTLDDPRIFGWGFIHGPEWLTKVQMSFDHEKLGLYQERMWIPFAMLNTAKVCEALRAGFSFIDRMTYNDFPLIPRLSKLLYRRFHYKQLVRTRLDILKPFRQTYYHAKPSYVYGDTGADIYQYLRYDRDYLFVGLPAGVHGKYISHFHGITRKVLEPNQTNAASLDAVVKGLFTRLRTIYGVEVPGADH